MLDGYTYAIISTVGFLIAVEVPLPVEMTALVMVGLVLRWSLSRQNRVHDEHEDRLNQIEVELAETREAKDIERHLKHAWKNEVTATRATLAMIYPQAARCSCGTMEPLLETLRKLAVETKEPS